MLKRSSFVFAFQLNRYITANVVILKSNTFLFRNLNHEKQKAHTNSAHYEFLKGSEDVLCFSINKEIQYCVMEVTQPKLQALKKVLS